MITERVPTITVPHIKHNVTHEEYLASTFYIPVDKEGQPVAFTQDPDRYEAYVVSATAQRDSELFEQRVWFGCVVFLAHVKRYVSYWDAAKDIKGSTIHSSHMRMRRAEELDLDTVKIEPL